MPKKVESSPSPPPAPKANRHPKEEPLMKLEDDIEPPAPVTAAPTTDPFEAAAGHPISRCPNADTEPPDADAGKKSKDCNDKALPK